MKHVIHIYGASGSGTSTLGRELSRQTGFRFMDTDDYFWMPTEPRYTVKRPIEERIALMKKDILEAENAVISGSLVDWGDPLIPYFTLAVRLETDTRVRIARIRKREFQKFGERIEAGGDMYLQHQAFVQWAAGYDSGDIHTRSRVKHDLWQEQLLCPRIELDGGADLEENVRAVRRELETCELEEQVKERIRPLFGRDSSGHDFWHSVRVCRTAMKLAAQEVCDRRIVMLAALLHDADDTKLFDTKNCQNARDIMEACGIDRTQAQRVIHVISAVSFSENGREIPDTVEGQIVQDADRLDAMGAIGIARAFACGASRGRAIYEPEEGGALEKGTVRGGGTTIDHFYEKLLLLKEGMHTGTARKMAEERETVMRTFLEEFYAEWKGKR